MVRRKRRGRTRTRQPEGGARRDGRCRGTSRGQGGGAARPAAPDASGGVRWIARGEGPALRRRGPAGPGLRRPRCRSRGDGQGRRTGRGQRMGLLCLGLAPGACAVAMLRMLGRSWPRAGRLRCTGRHCQVLAHSQVQGNANGRVEEHGQQQEAQEKRVHGRRLERHHTDESGFSIAKTLLLPAWPCWFCARPVGCPGPQPSGCRPQGQCYAGRASGHSPWVCHRPPCSMPTLRERSSPEMSTPRSLSPSHRAFAAVASRVAATVMCGT